MGSGPANIVTIHTRYRAWWAWWLIAAARWLHGRSGEFVDWTER